MFALVRNLVIVYLILTIVYVVLSFFARVKERNRLEEEYRAQGTTEKAIESEDVYVARGMTAYYRSWRPKMVLLVYIIPSLIVFALVYLAQYG